MYILGLNAYHADSSAAIFKDGVMIAATEEERFRRIKHWAGFPSEAIKFCLNEVGITIDQVDHISSLDEYKVALEAGCTPEEALKAVSRFSRDNARTPMQWTDGENAGFTTGKPWLKVNANYTKINAESQMNDPESVRSFYKKLIALRKNPEYKETVVYGELEPVWEDVHNLMAYYRKGDKNLLVVGNYQKEPQTIELAGECRKVLINNYDKVAMDGNKIELQGYQFLVIEM